MGDVFTFTLNTAFRQYAAADSTNSNRYSLPFSPGSFADVPSSVSPKEDYWPSRSHPRHYDREIKTTWKRTATGFSGEIAISVFYFLDGGVFRPGYEFDLSFGAQKTLPLSMGP